MKISPLSSSGMTVGAVSAQGASTASPIVEQIRSLKMKVNRTPGFEPEDDPPQDPAAAAAAVPSAEAAPAAPEMPISSTSVDPAQPAPEAVQPLSPQYAAFAREKRAFAAEKKAFEDQKKAFEESRGQNPGFSVEQLTSDPIGTLLKAGLTWEQLTDAAVNFRQAGGNDTIALQKRIADLEAGLEKKLSDRDTLQEQQALAAMEREAKLLIAQGDEFELVRETKNLPEVMRLIRDTYKESGEVLDVAEACRLVEDELLKDAQRLAALKKLQPQTQPAQVQPGKVPQPVRQMRTLTNRDTASVPMDRRTRAILAAEGKFKR